MVFRLLSPWLMLPQDHGLHHGYHEHHEPNHEPQPVNFGANLKVWDKLHGTYQRATTFPKTLGMQTTLTFWQKLLYPFDTP